MPFIEGGEGRHGPSAVGDDNVLPRSSLSYPLACLDVQVPNRDLPHVHNVSHLDEECNMRTNAAVQDDELQARRGKMGNAGFEPTALGLWLRRP